MAPQANQQANKQPQGWNPLQFQQMLQAIMQRQNMLAQPRMNPLAQYWLNAGVPGVGAAQNMINMANASLMSGVNRLNNTVFYDPNNMPLSPHQKMMELLSVILGGRGIDRITDIAGAKGAVSRSGKRGHMSKNGGIVTKEGTRGRELSIKSVDNKPNRFRGLNKRENQQVRGGANAAIAGFQNVEAPKMRKQLRNYMSDVKSAQGREMAGNIKSQRSRDQLLSKAKQQESQKYKDLISTVVSMLKP